MHNLPKPRIPLDITDEFMSLLRQQYANLLTLKKEQPFFNRLSLVIEDNTLTPWFDIHRPNQPDFIRKDYHRLDGQTGHQNFNERQFSASIAPSCHHMTTILFLMLDNIHANHSIQRQEKQSPASFHITFNPQTLTTSLSIHNLLYFGKERWMPSLHFNDNKNLKKTEKILKYLTNTPYTPNQKLYIFPDPNPYLADIKKIHAASLDDVIGFCLLCQDNFHVDSIIKKWESSPMRFQEKQNYEKSIARVTHYFRLKKIETNRESLRAIEERPFPMGEKPLTINRDIFKFIEYAHGKKSKIDELCQRYDKNLTLDITTQGAQIAPMMFRSLLDDADTTLSHHQKMNLVYDNEHLKKEISPVAGSLIRINEAIKARRGVITTEHGNYPFGFKISQDHISLSLECLGVDVNDKGFIRINAASCEAIKEDENHLIKMLGSYLIALTHINRFETLDEYVFEHINADGVEKHTLVCADSLLNAAMLYLIYHHRNHLVDDYFKIHSKGQIVGNIDILENARTTLISLSDGLMEKLAKKISQNEGKTRRS